MWIRSGWQKIMALAGAFIPGLVTAATLSWAPASLAIVRGQVAYIDLRISGLEDTSVWGYALGIGYDQAVVQLVDVGWGDGKGGNQILCPGSTPSTCYHLGSAINTNSYWLPGWNGAYLTEHVNALHWNPDIDLDGMQLDDFALLHLGFVGVGEGSTGLTAEGYFQSHPWNSTDFFLPAVSTQIDVALAEPDSWLLGLLGLAGMAALSLRRRAHHLLETRR